MQAVVLEAEHHQQTIARTDAVIRRLEIFAPLVCGLLLLPLTFPVVAVREDRLAALVILMMSAAGLLGAFYYVQYLELVRYKYIVLYPRLFSLADQPRWINYLEFTTPRSLRSWVPILFYNAITVIVLVALWGRFLWGPALETGSREAWGLRIIAAVSLAAGFVSTYVVILAARTLEREAKFAVGRTWDLPKPFRSSLRLVPRNDGKYFILAHDLAVTVTRSGTRKDVTVPLYFSTDLTSIPAIFWPVLPPWERYGPAALVHDYLYSREDWSRFEADRVLLELMESLGVGRFRRACIYGAVRCFGRSARVAAQRRECLDDETAKRLIERADLGERGAVI